ncbi:hypothetical protein BD310DRAFT_170658 [Dichomitus squalens]|uniref:Uncharacterized protein n=1 Tax=Dichomitus squalens TaxID=114155 RepID=A0A4Q9PE63_9APHY|nr:hypothetical protein BD310DRAFT_170658 [Dichomitus squalens]
MRARAAMMHKVAGGWSPPGCPRRRWCLAGRAGAVDVLLEDTCRPGVGRRAGENRFGGDADAACVIAPDGERTSPSSPALGPRPAPQSRSCPFRLRTWRTRTGTREICFRGGRPAPSSGIRECPYRACTDHCATCALQVSSCWPNEASADCNTGQPAIDLHWQGTWRPQRSQLPSSLHAPRGSTEKDLRAGSGGVSCGKGRQTAAQRRTRAVGRVRRTRGECVDSHAPSIPARAHDTPAAGRRSRLGSRGAPGGVAHYRSSEKRLTKAGPHKRRWT